MNRLALAALGLLTASCSSLRFEGVEKVEERYDDAVGAHVVRVKFEVLRGDLPVQGLSVHDFEMYEDDVRATSEAIQEVALDEVRLPVAVLLDTSYSMYRENAIGALKTAALAFTNELRSAGFEVQVWGFDSDVRSVASIESIPEAWEGRDERSRWTALYYAVQHVLLESPNAILVVFSDGADNYSQNHEIEGFPDIAPLVATRQIHAIGFGAVRREFDRHGNDAITVLRALATNGTYEYASNEEAISDVFGYIARRLRNIYLVEYYSPNRSGEHALELRYRSARTEPILFYPHGPGE